MTPEDEALEDEAARRKYKRKLQKTADREGLQEVILDMAVDLKVNTDRDKKDREVLTTHLGADAETAHHHPITFYLKLAAIVAVISGGVAGTAGAMG